jgi:citrate lyase beta subunit
MDKIILNEAGEGVRLIVKDSKPQNFNRETRSPVHVVCGGAHLYRAGTPQKLGRIALKSLETYAPNFVEFARAMWLKGADALPQYEDAIQNLEFQIVDNPEKVKEENFDAWFAWTIYRRTIEKLKTEAVEDFRIDFEDGYGFRNDAEEDADAISASDELAKAFLENTITPFCGFRIKSFAPETFQRAIRTLDLFLNNLLEKTSGRLPENFVVTLPKITDEKEVKELRNRLEKFEKENNLPEGAIKIELMIETPQAIVSEKGKIAPGKLVKAGNGRVTSAHFGAFDYTASLGIAGAHQHLRHEACNFARQMMLISLSPLNIRLSDSVTTELPAAVHKGENLSEKQSKENKFAIHKAWRVHFNNVTHSLIDGFYQSWDLHPAQLPARYAAVYAFFLEAQDEQAGRLKGFIEKAARARATSGAFDDAATAQGLLNFFLRALNCGALAEKEILETTGLNVEELRAASFLQIMENRRKRSAKSV